MYSVWYKVKRISLSLEVEVASVLNTCVENCCYTSDRYSTTSRYYYKYSGAVYKKFKYNEGKLHCLCVHAEVLQ